MILDMGVVIDKNGFFLQKDDGGEMVWRVAKSYCRDLYLAEHRNWKLPDKNTLESAFYRGDHLTSSNLFFKDKIL